MSLTWLRKQTMVRSKLRDEQPDPQSDLNRGRQDLTDLIHRLSPRMRATDGADELIRALERVATCEPHDLAKAAEVAGERLRLLFYASIGRRAPLDLRSMPAYVVSTQRRYHLVSKNAARELLAHVEGHRSWSSLMRAALTNPLI